MKKYTKHILATSMLIFSLGASAASSYDSPLKPDTIESITVGSTGHLYIYMKTSSRFHNPANCSIRRYTIKSNNPIFDYFFVQLLLAWKEGYNVNFNVENSQCFVNGAVVARFNVEK